MASALDIPASRPDRAGKPGHDRDVLLSAEFVQFLQLNSGSDCDSRSEFPLVPMEAFGCELLGERNVFHAMGEYLEGQWRQGPAGKVMPGVFDNESDVMPGCEPRGRLDVLG
jgi:hypothetical protein